MKIIDNNNRDRKKTIYQFTMSGLFIAEYVGVGVVSREFGIVASSLVSCCRYRRKSAGGYLWSYSRHPVYHTKHKFIEVSQKTDDKIYQFDKDYNFVAEFENIIICSDTLDLSAQNIILCCRYPDKIFAGFYFSHDRYNYNCPNKFPLPNDKFYNVFKGVRQFTLEGEFVARFDSVGACARELNLVPSSISAVCKGKQKTTGKFKFEYV